MQALRGLFIFYLYLCPWLQKLWRITAVTKDFLVTWREWTIVFPFGEWWLTKIRPKWTKQISQIINMCLPWFRSCFLILLKSSQPHVVLMTLSIYSGPRSHYWISKRIAKTLCRTHLILHVSHWNGCYGLCWTIFHSFTGQQRLKKFQTKTNFIPCLRNLK